MLNLKQVAKLANSNNEQERLEVRRKLQKQIRELVDFIKVYPKGEPYLKLLKYCDSPEEQKVLKSTKYAQESRSVTVCFKGGGEIAFGTDFRNGGMRRWWEKDAEGKFDQKTQKEIDGIRETHKSWREQRPSDEEIEEFLNSISDDD